MLCEYALNSNNELVFIDDVPNGEACNCHCIKCNGKLIARNGGEKRKHHFSHFSCPDCGGYRETILHIWSKQIIEEYKKLAVPSYRSVVDGYLLINPYDEKIFEVEEQIIQFSSVEIESRADLDELQPDIIGVTNEGLRLWIEIYVTHKCAEKKISIIKENGINCIEVKIPDDIDTKEELTEYLTNSMDSEYKYFINYPSGENIILKNKREFYTKLLQKCRKVSYEECSYCFKENILQSNYSHLLDEYRGKLPNDFNYIFKYKLLKNLIEKYPNLKYIDSAIHHKRFSFYKNNINALTEEDYQLLLDFCLRLSVLFQFYGYGVTGSFHWNCAHIYAEAIKNKNVFVFCLKDEFLEEIDNDSL